MVNHGIGHHHRLLLQFGTDIGKTFTQHQLRLCALRGGHPAGRPEIKALGKVGLWYHYPPIAFAKRFAAMPRTLPRSIELQPKSKPEIPNACRDQRQKLNESFCTKIRPSFRTRVDDTRLWTFLPVAPNVYQASHSTRPSVAVSSIDPEFHPQIGPADQQHLPHGTHMGRVEM